MHSSQPSRRDFLVNSLLLAGSLSTVPCRLLAQSRTTQSQAASTTSQGARGVVATVHPLASQAAIEAFGQGGNAIDAAVAASIMLSVVDGHNSGIGGGCLALIRQADGRVWAIDAREKAPAAAKPEIFFRNGLPDPELSQKGPLAVGVPGLLAGLHAMSSEYGAIEWKAALLRAAEVAEAGFAISQDYARVIRSAAQDLRDFPESAAILLDESGNPWQAGHELRQHDLSRTLRSIAEQGPDWFYRGEFAERCARFIQASGGLLTEQDFADYAIASRRPIQLPYREHSVIDFPPPSSGGILVAQMLGMLSRFDVQAIFADSFATGLHLLLEVMKRAMADRAHWLGDADYTKVPRGLLDADYLRSRADSIDLKRATPVDSHGQPPRADLDLFGQHKHTTHLTTADDQGNVVAMTQTVNTSFGCKMITPGTGVVLNNEMDDFSIAPGVRNAFGLLGSDANLVAPGKRPLSSMSPTIVLNQDRQPVLSCGAAGGPKIITSVLQVLVRVLDLGQSIEQALAAPRLHHQWSPDKAVCEKALPAATLLDLMQRGHVVETLERSAVAQAIAGDPDDQLLYAASDPRVPSSAMSL